MRRIDLKKVSVARSNTIRNINRQIVLNYVRERSPISRAEIAQETAPQRSTISLIVDELKARAALARYANLCGSTDGRSELTFAQIMDRALNGETVARTALLETAHFLGIGISNLIKELSPEAVIIGGQIARAWALIGEELKSAVDENSICRGLPSASIIASSLGANPRLMGALSLVLASKFASM